MYAICSTPTCVNKGIAVEVGDALSVVCGPCGELAAVSTDNPTIKRPKPVD